MKVLKMTPGRTELEKTIRLASPESKLLLIEETQEGEIFLTQSENVEGRDLALMHVGLMDFLLSHE